jgi:crotonobetainyl-CoA:carnitine CoA-transferase CaiB-like acyl-CoA transferase
VSALSHLRILELAGGVAGEHCGRLLADFGAEIIKIEPPVAGSPTRHIGPFSQAAADPERSGLFAFLNTNKRSVCLDLATHDGKQALRVLLSGVDAVIDDHPPGFLESLGIHPHQLARDFPLLVLCSVTPFGYDATPAQQQAQGINVLHSAWGYHSPSEANPEKPPLKGVGRFLGEYEAGLSAALALTAALYWRETSGQGQFVDVSQQEALCSLVDYVLGQMVAGTMEVSHRRRAFDLGGPATFFKCRDGYSYLWLSEPGHWNGLSTLMGNPAWMREDFPERWLELHVTPERIARCRAHIAEWIKHQNKAEVAERAQKLGVALVPVNTMEDVFRSPQMAHRNFFAQLDHPKLGPLHYPTVPYRLSATPAAATRAAPLLGEHTQPVLRDAARGEVTRNEAAGDAARGSPAVRPGTSAAAHAPEATTLRRMPGPLQGVRVLEHTKVWAGPYVGKLLAFLGAEVIRVESCDSLDATRRFGTKDINDAPGFQAINPGKYSVQISLKGDEGRHVMKQLVKVCDVFVENLRPGAVRRQGLGYDELRALKPDIVAVSMSMWGQEGPLSYQTGYAPCFSALSGLCHLAGYENGPPELINTRYGDSSYGTAAAFATVVALYHRRRTGAGQYIDISAVESLSSNLGDSFMEYFIMGRSPERDGNRHADMAPHGVYRCRNEDWITLAVRTDNEWRMLCDLMGQPGLACDTRFTDLNARQAQRHELDRILGEWARGQDALEICTRLQQAGICAFKSMNSIDLISQDHLWKRGFYRHVADDQQRSIAIVGAPWKLSRTPATIEHAAPRLGEQNDYVLGTLLGLSAQERQRLAAAKVIY